MKHLKASHILYAGFLICMVTAGLCYGSAEHQAFFIVLGMICFGFALLAQTLNW